jgi:hypothetical protein
MHPPDELDEYLRGDSALSCQYRREPAPAPPPALDRRVLELSRVARDLSAVSDPRAVRAAPARSPYLAPLAFAASVLLSVALVLAIVFGPQTAKRVDDAPRVVRVAYSSYPKPVRAPKAWLADIAALRRAGRNREADEELRRFRSTYPGLATAAIDDPHIRP